MRARSLLRAVHDQKCASRWAHHLCLCSLRGAKAGRHAHDATAEPPRLKRIQAYQAKPEPEGDAFESFDAFLLAKLGSDDAVVAEAAREALARVSGQREEEEVGEEEV